MASRPSRAQIIFVNQTPQTNKPSQNQLSAIRSHSKKVQYRRARLRAAEQYQSTFEQSLTSRHTGGGSTPESSLFNTVSTNDDSSDQLSCYPTPPRSPDHDRLLMGPQSRISSLNIVAGASIDPFNQAPIILDQETHTILQYFYKFFLVGSNTEPSELLPPRVRRHHERHIVEQILRDSFSDAQHMLSLLSMTAARIDAFSPGTLTPNRAAALNIQAVKHLRRLSPARLDHRTLYDICCLAATCAYTGDYTAARAHFEAFSRLLPLVKINATREHLMHFVLVLDVIFAMSTDKEPMLAWPDVFDRRCRAQPPASNADTYSNTSFSSDPTSEGSSSILGTSSTLSFSMGSGLIFLSEHLVIPSRLRVLLDEVGTCGQLARFVYLSPESTAADAHALCMSLLRLHHSVLSEHFDGIAEAIRLCISINLSYLRTRLSARSANSNAKRLAEVLNQQNSKAGSDVEIDRLILWVGVVGTAAAADPKLKRWFLDMLLLAARKTGLRTAGEIRQHTQTYFYLDAVHGPTLQACEERLEQDPARGSIQDQAWHTAQDG